MNGSPISAKKMLSFTIKNEDSTAMQKFKMKTEVCFGENALSALSEIEAKNAAIFTDAFLAKNGTADRVAALLTGCKNTKIYAEIKPDPPVELIADALKFLLDADADVVIAVGGGSSIDAAKSTTLIAREKTGKELPLVAIPTTSGTGSEVTKFAVITDKAAGVKYPLVTEDLLPVKAILDGDLVKSVPPQITSDTGFDVITHALEAYISTAANDFSDALAEKALELAFKYLPVAFAEGENAEAREKMHTASCLAGMAFSEVSLGVNHGIAHGLGANFHIPHGRANAMVLPYVMYFNAELDKDGDCYASRKMATIAARLGLPAFSPKAGALSLVTLIAEMGKQLSVPQSFADCKVSREDYEKTKQHIINSALKDACTVTNPRKVTADDVAEILSHLEKF